MSEHLARIALNCVPKVGAVKVQSLLDAFGTLADVAKVSPLAIEQSCRGIGIETANAIRSALKANIGQREVDKASQCGVTILTALSDDWPRAFDDLDSPPLALYCVGNTALLNTPQVAIIGTRAATLYGKDQAKRFAQYLASAGIHITSGLALGIDTAAHKGALEAKALGKTIAVVGSGLDNLYPQENRPLAREIVHQGGLVISEYPFGRHADTQTFPQRNRLLAALVKGVLVAETANRGGTMNTVTHATRLKRPLFALPGRIEWPSYQGNHKLIREGIARLVTHGEHILKDLNAFKFAPHANLNEANVLTLSEASASESHDTQLLGLSELEEKVWKALDLDGVLLDDLAEATGLPAPQLLPITTRLQLRKCLRVLPGGRFARISR
jgi:DNA processing protein